MRSSFTLPQSLRLKILIDAAKESWTYGIYWKSELGSNNTFLKLGEGYFEDFNDAVMSVQWFYLGSSLYYDGGGLPAKSFQSRRPYLLTGSDLLLSSSCCRTWLAHMSGIRTIVYVPTRSGLVELGSTEVISLPVEDILDRINILFHHFDCFGAAARPGLPPPVAVQGDLEPFQLKSDIHLPFPDDMFYFHSALPIQGGSDTRVKRMKIDDDESPSRPPLSPLSIMARDPELLCEQGNHPAVARLIKILKDLSPEIHHATILAVEDLMFSKQGQDVEPRSQGGAAQLSPTAQILTYTFIFW
ncbi:Transcription factor ATR2 [Platanthera guangdongensis]|uniref:Transcription factor n=1 Tax=Platanthera guangdongensis TaxID=2320717 RepID=A0ABR2LLN2_9ASPA